MTKFVDAIDAGANAVKAAAKGQRFVLHLSGEESDYVRFNHARVRQAGSVRQLDATLTLANGNRHATEVLSLTHDAIVDAERLTSATERLNAALDHVDEDPYFCFADDDIQEQPVDFASGDDQDTSSPDDGAAIVDAIGEDTRGLDFVGIVANGSVSRGLTTSGGKRRAFSRAITHLDWSIYAGEGAPPDKAIKQSLAGPRFDRDAFGVLLDDARAKLPALRREVKRVEPGSYRAYLAPAAVDEILSLLAYGTFSQRAIQSKTSALLGMQLGESKMDSRFHLVEASNGGTSPRFNRSGFDRPDAVVLIDHGQYGGALTSPRSAQEYGVPHTGADAAEGPTALCLEPGTLAPDAVLSTLGTGVYVGNLWYCNFSDPRACRVTGMTRFGTFWVEDGVIVAPLGAMRFDTSLYDLFGEALIDLDNTNPLSVDADTYGQRSTSSKRVPGAMVSDFPLTL